MLVFSCVFSLSLPCLQELLEQNGALVCKSPQVCVLALWGIQACRLGGLSSAYVCV